MRGLFFCCLLYGRQRYGRVGCLLLGLDVENIFGMGSRQINFISCFQESYLEVIFNVRAVDGEDAMENVDLFGSGFKILFELNFVEGLF